MKHCIAYIISFLMGVATMITLFILGSPSTSFSLIGLPRSANKEPIRAGIAPHHLHAQTLLDQFYARLRKSEHKLFVVVSPDHFFTGRELIVSGNFPEMPSWIPDTTLQRLRQEVPIEINNSLVKNEHGIMVHYDLLSKTFHNVPILPIMISQKSDAATPEKLFTILKKHFPEATVIASVDFSHYLPKNIADLHDLSSFNALSSFSYDRFPSLEVDCWQCLHLVSRWAENKSQFQINLLQHSNSETIDNATRPYDETTSYFTIFFEQGPKKPENESGTMLFLGDIMLGRYVKELMNQYGMSYPVLKAEHLLRGFEQVIANFEGSLPRTDVQPSHDTQFVFDPRSAVLLKKTNVSMVTLANNHTLDFGESVFAETKQQLMDAKIQTIGHPRNPSDPLNIVVGNRKVRLIALSFLNGYTNNSALSQKYDDTSLTIATIHWGTEYNTVANSFQQNIGHQLIENGVDIIIGHHPHVAQNIEVYRNKIIFYSLGNFIFDQYFSTEVEQGLGLALKIEDTGVTFTLIPLQSNLSQPRRMSLSEQKTWLQQLSSISSAHIGESILLGTFFMNI